MKKYIIGFIIILLLIAGCFYLVFSRDENLTITYIRFKVNPEFVIGINNNERVVFYNPLNEDAKIFNLMMFNNKTLDEACEIFIEKMDENNYLVNKKIDLTIITKNLEKERKIVQKIKDSVIKLDSEIEISTVSPTSEELLSYSNETAYGLPVTYDNIVLQTIGKEIKDNIDFYIQNKIKLLNLDKLSNDKKIEIIKENPFKNPPPYEKLIGDLKGAYSRRINIKNRLIYQVIEDKKLVKIISLWTHYER